MFSGAGLYEDLELGWRGLAEQGVRVHAIPVDHKDNRMLMREPHAGKWLRSCRGISRWPEPRRPGSDRSHPASDRPWAGTRGESSEPSRIRRRQTAAPAFPKPLYHFGRSRFYDARRLARRNPGRGRVLPDYLIIGVAKGGNDDFVRAG